MVAVHVAQLLKAPVGTQRLVEFADDEPEFTRELDLRGPLTGRARLVRTSHGILVECDYRAELERECGRCLGLARPVVEGRFNQEFLPTTSVYTGLPETVVADPDEPRIGSDHVLDLDEAIRQDIVIEQPLQPLCRPDCAGLCPRCGQDLNEAVCTCSGVDEGEGLSRLGELLKEKLSRGA